MSSNSAAPQTSYEIYILEGGSRWILHGRRGPAERKLAIDEAKSLDLQNGIKAVKVVKEVYYPEDNTAEEVIVYKTRDLKEKPAGSEPKRPSRPKPSGIEAQAVEREQERDAEKAREPKPRKAKKARDPNAGLSVVEAILRIGIITMLSLGMGVVFTISTDFGLGRLRASGVSVDQFQYDLALLCAFLLGFVITLIPLLTRLLKRLGKGSRVKEPDLVAEAVATSKRQRAALPKTVTASPPPSVEEQKQDEPEPEPEQEEEPPQPAEEELETPPEEDTQPEAEAEQPVVETPKLRKAKTQMMKFLSASIESVKRTAHRLDARNKFGVSLFVAGAADKCAESASLDSRSHNSVLADCITALGTAPQMSQTFCDRMGEYLMEPQYKAMFDKGRGSMDGFIQTGESAATGIEEALDEWNRPVQTATTKLMAVMFTDIVNSTALTQRLGDHGAQEMIQIHNKIVRTELVNQLGREIKHMGDGIMCSFNSPTAAVEAAVGMQRAFLKHNGSGHHIAFEVRIGINAGEPIKEENDLFGSTVQLAARVCAKAGGYQIFVSGNVKDTSSAKSANFTSKGAFELKGFAEPVELFEAVWR